MKQRTLLLAGAVLAVLVAAGARTVPGVAAAAATSGTEPPRLILLVAVDQMRYDYLPRFAEGFTGGLRRLMQEGAVYTNAHLDHYPTVTAVGHMAMLSGAPPALSGIVGNDWYDRELKRSVTSVSDPATRLLGAEGTGSSPHRLKVSTLGDELKMAHPGSRVVGVAAKDRSAILPAGRMADLATWWDTKTGAFVSSTWYAAELPRWLAEFNARKPADAWLGREWRELGPDGKEGALLATLPDTPGSTYYGRLYNSGFGNDLLVAAAEAALVGEGLGSRPGRTDILTLSFSCNDAVGHDKGPHAREVRDVTVRTDRALRRLLATVDQRVGLRRTVVVLTADHGVAPVPEQMKQWKMPGGRLSRADLEGNVEAVLAKAFGPGGWVAGRAGSSIYLNRELIAEKGLDPAAVERAAASGLDKVPMIWRTYTRTQLLEGRVPPDPWSRRLLISFDRERSGDVEVLYEPYWLAGTSGTSHGTPYSYDTHIPLIVMGPGIRPGRHHRPVVLNDLAPTLATLLGIETPSGSSGQVLIETLARPTPATGGAPPSGQPAVGRP
jgi:predicted AlkP superfamily pyrophosphatase or phosphodiesterase